MKKKSARSSGKAPHFLVHNSDDSVGVAAVEGITAGQTLMGWVMDTDATIRVKALDDIPLGHKVALRQHKVGDTVVKYGHDIGKVVEGFTKGSHCHVHNTKTKRW